MCIQVYLDCLQDFAELQLILVLNCCQTQNSCGLLVDNLPERECITNSGKPVW